jgi:hypothetical protein
MRSDVLRFDPDGVTRDKLNDLRRCSEFLEELHRVTK